MSESSFIHLLKLDFIPFFVDLFAQLLVELSERLSVQSACTSRHGSWGHIEVAEASRKNLG
eukprot:scaffold443426_cov23-Prasinocladus_malaysianus.AAC.1